MQIKHLLLLPLFVLLITACSDDDSHKPDVYVSQGVAIDGYDPVAYFTLAEATPGKESIQASHNGITYQFSTEEHRQLFTSQPEKYLPAYGGWCAYAVAENSFKMEPDPTNWQIQDDRLLLFYADFWTSLQGGLKAEWNTAPTDYEQKANYNWADMVAE